MKSKIIILLLTLTCPLYFYAEDKIYFGKISNIDYTPAKYVLVSFLDKQNVLQSTQTDSLGYYRIKIDLPLTGCSLIVTNWGNKLYEDSLLHTREAKIEKNILLKEVNELGLDEITVNGERKGFTLKNDRYVYSPDAALIVSSTAFDVIKQIPGIKIDDDQISLLFKPSASIYINNRPISIPVNSLIEYLKSMPSDNIKNIEIITNPGSHYESSTTGGIVNIVLRKNINDGFNGQVSISDMQARKNRQIGRSSFIYHKDKLGLEGGLFLLNYAAKSIEYSDIITKSGKVQQNKTYALSKNKNISLNLGLEYAPNDKHLFNLLSILKFNKPSSIDVSYTEYSDLEFRLRTDSLTYTESEDRKKKVNNYFFNGSYQYILDKKGQILNVSFDYLNYVNECQKYTKNQRIEDSGIFTDRSMYMTSVPQKIKNYSSRIDYTLPFKKNNIGLGALHSYNKTEDENSWKDWSGTEYILNPDKSNIFTYIENIGAVYGTMSRQWSDNLSTDLGFRLEFTSRSSNIIGNQIDIYENNSLQLFPSFMFSYKPNKIWVFNYSLTGKVRRPAFRELNPARIYLNENLYIENNPYLRNSRLFTQELSLTLQNKYALNLEHRYEKNGTGQFLIPSPDSESTNYYGRFNYGNNQSLYIYMVMPFSFFSSFWKSNVSAGIQYNSFNIKNPDISKYCKNESGVNAAITVSNTFQLSQKQNFLAYLNFKYNSPRITLNRKAINYPIFNLELKKIWTDWTISLICNDLTNGTKLIARETAKQTLSPYLKNNFTIYPDNRSIQLRISYRFGNSRTKTNRKVQVANDEIRGRVN